MAKHIEKGRNTFFAVFCVRWDAQRKLGQNWFRQSLKTDIEAAAKRHMLVFVAGWEAQIEEARSKSRRALAARLRNIRFPQPKRP